MSYVTFPGLGLNLVMNRVAFSIFGKDIYWYGIIIALGFGVAVLYAFFKCEDFGVNSDQVIDYLIFGTVCGIVGSRLYYVIFNFDNFKDDLLSIFYIWEGGLAIYGAVIGAFASGILTSKVKKLNPWKMFDLASIGFLFGQIFGRWGNFVNAEAYGKTFSSQNIDELPFWAMGIGGRYVHPIFLYESLWNLLGLILVFTVVKRHRRFGGQITVFYFGWYGLGRFFTEGIRGGDELYLFGTDLRVSQVLAALMFLAAAAIFLFKFLNPKKKGPLGMIALLPKDHGLEGEELVSALYPDPADENTEEERDETEQEEETEPDKGEGEKE